MQFVMCFPGVTILLTIHGRQSKPCPQVPIFPHRQYVDRLFHVDCMLISGEKYWKMSPGKIILGFSSATFQDVPVSRYTCSPHTLVLQGTKAKTV